MAELVTTKEGHRFYFSGNVVVVGTDLLLKCDELEILSKARIQLFQVECESRCKISLMVARGKVSIKQKGSLGSWGQSHHASGYWFIHLARVSCCSS